MGELFSTIVERQFLSWRNGDRYWFERSDQFSPEEIRTIPFAPIQVKRLS